MVLRALSVADDPPQIPAQLYGELVGDISGPAQPLSGIKPCLDALGEFHLLFGVEQGDLADLLEIRPHRINRDGELGVLAGLAQRLGLLLVPDEVLRTRTTWRRQLLNARSDLLDLDVGEVLGSGATLD